MAREIQITQSNAQMAMAYLKKTILEGLAGGDLSVNVRRPSKSREQEKLYHTLIGEIAAQVRTFGKRYDAEVWKAMLVDQFAVERAAMGEPLRNPGTVVPAMDGSGRMVTVRASTAKFSREEGGAFIEYLYAQGTEMGVRWSANAEQIAAAQQHGRAA